jgi:hypothetical protein
VVAELVAGPGVVVLADIPVTEGGTGEYVDRSDAGSLGLATSIALQDLRLLILGEHALELHQQLVFGAVAAWALDEFHPGAGASELLDQ